MFFLKDKKFVEKLVEKDKELSKQVRQNWM